MTKEEEIVLEQVRDAKKQLGDFINSSSDILNSPNITPKIQKIINGIVILSKQLIDGIENLEADFIAE
ncbi:MAG: hypothetical protein LBI37_00110 [Puniceicoccales bacterium]|jgi:urease gamma subunit|nr:hypothetical protein [Puniceicoccales bacterium]